MMPSPYVVRLMGASLAFLRVCALGSIAIMPSAALAWEIIAGDGSFASSDCIGRNDSVRCLADTAMACAAWSESARYMQGEYPVRHPICAVSNDFGVNVYSLAPHHLQVITYLTDTWLLQAKDIAEPGASTSWQVGDTVVDYYYAVCAPSRSCFEPLSYWVMNRESVWKLCPPTNCGGSPHLDPDYTQPLHTLIMRKVQDDHWIVLDFSRPSLHGSAGVSWLPDHWKRK